MLQNFTSQSSESPSKVRQRRVITRIMSAWIYQNCSIMRCQHAIHSKTIARSPCPQYRYSTKRKLQPICTESTNAVIITAKDVPLLLCARSLSHSTYSFAPSSRTPRRMYAEFLARQWRLHGFHAAAPCLQARPAVPEAVVQCLVVTTRHPPFISTGYCFAIERGLPLLGNAAVARVRLELEDGFLPA